MELVRSSTERLVVWQRTVPEAIRRLDSLDRTDYTDLFTADAPDASGRSAELWARAAFGGAPPLMRRLIPPVHRFILGLRLHVGRSADHLMG
jgi:hypothetical protein